MEKREKLKRDQIELFRKCATGVCTQLLNSVIPFSKRSTDKLLEIWELATRDIYDEPSRKSTENLEFSIGSDHEYNRTERSLIPESRSESEQDDESGEASSSANSTNYTPSQKTNLPRDDASSTLSDFENEEIRRTKEIQKETTPLYRLSKIGRKRKRLGEPHAEGGSIAKRMRLRNR